MDQETGRMILAVQQAAMEDEFYKKLLAEYEPISQRFAEAVRAMDPAHREALEDYFGVTGAMHLRLLELAVEDNLV